jgi:hypothetical protein
MNIDYIVMALIWIIGLILLKVFTPKNRKRKLIFAIFICQAFIWLSDLIHVKYKLLLFPTREFPHATDILITTDYFFYPLLCGFYIIYEPKVNLLWRTLYLSLWISGIVLFDVLIERYTNLIEYINYAWYWTWGVFFCLFALTNLIYHWFFHRSLFFRAEKRVTN